MRRLVPLLLLAASSAALAQAYPSKPIRMIIPLAPGGGADQAGRLVSDKMAIGLGQPVVIENRSGASTDIGIGTLARAAPDGYTIGVVPVGSVATGILVRNLPYDPLKDIAPISGITKSGLVLVTAGSSPYRSVSDLIAAAKANPGKLSFGSLGIGSAHHLSGELLKYMAKIDLLHVPYKGSSESSTAVIAGQIDVAIAGAAAVSQHLRSGRLRALAVTAPTRLPGLPDVPSMSETLPGYSAATGGLSLFGTGGTPADIINRLNAEVGRALQHPDIQKRIAITGEETDYLKPEELGRLFAEEIRRWTELVRSANLKLQ
jgi:tripartite-type tricarboxylate transporter receptor subunit TctC